MGEITSENHFDEKEEREKQIFFIQKKIPMRFFKQIVIEIERGEGREA